MLINALKCIHLLLTLSLLGSIFYCLILVSLKKYTELIRFNRIMLWLLVLTILTGTLLVYPKHFTFQTPWIKAAYIFVFLFGTIVSMLLVFKKRAYSRAVWGISYFLLMMILIGIVHDAVTKTTFLF